MSVPRSRLLGIRRRPVWAIAFWLAAVPGWNASAGAAESPASPTAPAEIVKPGLPSLSPDTRAIVPSRSELPDSAFKKLDVGSKGYVTKADAHELQGFDKAFDMADPQRTGRLNAAQFQKAWKAYSTGP
ncbi:MAG: hypothetical protein ACM3X0_03350 [Bacteroidota bacterium]